MRVVLRWCRQVPPIFPEDGARFGDAPTRVKASSPPYLEHRLLRVANEAVFLALVFRDGVRFDELRGDWVIVPRFPLPRRWGIAAAQLLVLIPPAYPYVPPVGFYLDRHLTFPDGVWTSIFWSWCSWLRRTCGVRTGIGTARPFLLMRRVVGVLPVMFVIRTICSLTAAMAFDALSREA